LEESLFLVGHGIGDCDTLKVGHIEVWAFWVDAYEAVEVTITVCFTSHLKIL
jgi:hypothetical protein